MILFILNFNRFWCEIIRNFTRSPEVQGYALSTLVLNIPVFNIIAILKYYAILPENTIITKFDTGEFLILCSYIFILAINIFITQSKKALFNYRKLPIIKTSYLYAIILYIGTSILSLIITVSFIRTHV